jgi:hypothetical protein
MRIRKRYWADGSDRPGDVPGFAGAGRAEAGRGDGLVGQRHIKGLQRLLNAFMCELEGASVVAVGEGSTALGEAFGLKTATICGRASV